MQTSWHKVRRRVRCEKSAPLIRSWTHCSTGPNSVGTLRDPRAKSSTGVTFRQPGANSRKVFSNFAGLSRKTRCSQSCELDQHSDREGCRNFADYSLPVTELNNPPCESGLSFQGPAFSVTPAVTTSVVSASASSPDKRLKTRLDW